MTEIGAEKRAQARLPFDGAVRACEEKIDHALTAAPPVIRRYTAHLSQSRGKMIRAHALLACAQGSDGLVSGDGPAFAAAIELLHLATLVHDDVIDDADTRRGLPSLQKQFGKRTAVICGDYLLAAALRLGSAAEDREHYLRLDLPDYVGRICMGELRQHIHNGDWDLKVTDYLRIIRGKTAALFEASFFAGAILATEDQRLVDAYARLGRYVGMIFQLTDDCIDYDLDEGTAKKPVCSDYDQGVVTLPLIHAFQTEPGLREQARSGALDRRAAAEAVRRKDGVGFTRRFARRYYDKARAVLAALDPMPEKRARLAELLEQSYRGPKPQAR